MRAETNVTRTELAEAYGGFLPAPDESRLVVECPDDYDVEAITAEDIVHDGAIRVVDPAKQSVDDDES